MSAPAPASDRDPFDRFRRRFRIPAAPNGGESLYLCGNSLGLQSIDAADAVREVLESWADRGVAGHFDGPHPWMPYHAELTADLAQLTGARAHEVVAMNSLTVNLHLMLVSFFRPTRERYRIVIEKQAFPSDRYAVASQLRFHGLHPADALVELEDEPGSATLSPATLERYLAAEGRHVALILMPGVQYLSGQLQDMAGICELARAHGAAIGLDLAHAIGNVPLALNAWGPDFAVWCSYKYLNAGPGSVGGCFVHERHAERIDLPRFAGWWGHDQASRFAMGPDFLPTPGAEGWQLSNPPILALAPVRASLRMFCEAGMDALRQRSRELTARFASQIEARLGDSVRLRTPADPDRRGCQLSLALTLGAAAGRRVFERLEAAGVVCDWREPDVIRIAPVPLYNRLDDAERFVDHLKEAIDHAGRACDP